MFCRHPCGAANAGEDNLRTTDVEWDERRVDWSRQLVPELHLVAIGIREEHVRFTGHELTVAQHAAAGSLDGRDGG